MTGKERLHRALDRLPLDSEQGRALELGIMKMSEAEADEIAVDLEGALTELPKVLDKLEKLLAALEDDRNDKPRE